MKWVKTFESFINEEDPLAALSGGGEEGKAKEDPIKKAKKAEKEKKEKAEKKHDTMMDKKEDTAEDILKKFPEVDKKIGEKILLAIKDQDRVKIHNAVLDITYMQQKYQESGNEKMVSNLTKLKTMLDKLDKTYTNDKMM